MECKKTNKKIGLSDVKEFVFKVQGLKEIDYSITAVYYSEIGFTKPAEKYMKESNIMWTEKEKWTCA